ncbi:MAG: hypothetical protein ACREQV_02795, partial [Candidatus Binatia bacterium]
MVNRVHCTLGMVLLAVGCGGPGNAGECGEIIAPETPPAKATHETLVRGRIVDGDGEAVEGMRVGTRFPEPVDPCHMLDVQTVMFTLGVTDSDGEYQLDVKSVAPPSAWKASVEGEVWIIAMRIVDGRTSVLDSVYLTFQAAPIG